MAGISTKPSAFARVVIAPDTPALVGLAISIWFLSLERVTVTNVFLPFAENNLVVKMALTTFCEIDFLPAILWIIGLTRR